MKQILKKMRLKVTTIFVYIDSSHLFHIMLFFIFSFIGSKIKLLESKMTNNRVNKIFCRVVIHLDLIVRSNNHKFKTKM